MKLPFKTKLSYGIGGICDNALYTLTGTYLLLYLTTVAGVNPAIAGTISQSAQFGKRFADRLSDLSLTRPCHDTGGENRS